MVVVIMAAHSNGQAIIFCSCSYYLFLLSFFACLFAVVGDLMSAIFPHMMWP